MDFTFSEEQEMCRAMFRDFSAKEVAPRAEELDHQEQPPLAALRRAAQQGFLGATLPEDYCGAELDYVSYALLIETLAGDCIPADGDRRNHRCLCPHRAGRRQRR